MESALMCSGTDYLEVLGINFSNHEKSAKLHHQRQTVVVVVPGQIPSDQVRPDPTRPDQTRPDQTRSDQIKPDQSRSVQIKDQIKPDQTTSGQMGYARLRVWEQTASDL